MYVEAPTNSQVLSGQQNSNSRAGKASELYQFPKWPWLRVTQVTERALALGYDSPGRKLSSAYSLWYADGMAVCVPFNLHQA